LREGRLCSTLLPPRCACPEHLELLRDDLRARRDRLCAGLAQAGLRPLLAAGTYFINADVGTDAVGFCAELPERCGVVAIPTSVFYDDQDAAPSLVRFAFCKREELIEEAARRLASLGTR
jgi:N-succinyldiaminopimelate aminotransferase